MQNMFVSCKAPFYRLARIIRLGYIEAPPLINYLEARFKSLKIDYPKTFPGEIVSHTMGHPYYTQLAFQQAVLFNTIEGRLPDIDELLTLILGAEKDYFEKVWEDISGNREYVYVLRAIAEDGKNLYQRLKAKNINIARAAKKLEGTGLLFKGKTSGYYISDPLLKRWIVQNL
jgi:hypothetical protein